jgi:hypothetical protein
MIYDKYRGKNTGPQCVNELTKKAATVVILSGYLLFCHRCGVRREAGERITKCFLFVPKSSIATEATELLGVE